MIDASSSHERDTEQCARLLSSLFLLLTTTVNCSSCSVALQWECTCSCLIDTVDDHIIILTISWMLIVVDIWVKNVINVSESSCVNVQWMLYHKSILINCSDNNWEPTILINSKMMLHMFIHSHCSMLTVFNDSWSMLNLNSINITEIAQRKQF